MPKNHAPHHGRRNGPAGLHQTVARVQEMVDLGFSDSDIREVLSHLTKRFAERGIAVDESDASGTALAERADEATRKALEFLRTSTVLIAGEFRPHLIDELLNERLSLVQAHDPTPHGHQPPHFRDLTWFYPNQFRGVLSLAEIRYLDVTAIVIDAFLDLNDLPLASPLAMIASRIWPKANVVAVLSEHRAPHHVGSLGRDIDHILYWE